MKIHFRSAALLAFAIALAASSARAQTRRVRIDEPACGSLPFTHARLIHLLSVELAMHRVTIADEAETSVRYEPLRCGDAGSPIEITIDRGGTSSAIEVEAVSARALALLIAELLRAPPRRPDPEEPTPELDPVEPAEPPSLASLLAHPAPVFARTEPAAPEPPPAPPPPPRTLEQTSITQGALMAHFLYNPENQSWLVGPHLEVAFKMPFWRHLRVHLDSYFGTGRSNWGVHLGAIGTGLWIGIAIGGADLSVELGARAAMNFGWAFSVPHYQISVNQWAMLALTLIARVAWRFDRGFSLIADFEAGGPILGRVEFRSLDAANMYGGGIHDPFVITRVGVMVD
jgi:hypothetical protein